jgi:hypothetical protein
MGEILNLFQEVPANIRLNGMAHYYSMDKISGTTLYDMVGNGQNGVIDGATSETGGVLGNCLYFDGASNVDLSGITFNNKVFCISMWIHSSEVSGTYRIIFDTYPTRFNFAWTNASSKISLYLGGSWVEFGDVPTDDEWHHLCLNINNTKAILYFDGVQFGAVKTIGSFDLSTITKVIVGSEYDGTDNFSGYIDELKIYNRNLTNEEIYKLYNISIPVVNCLTGIKVTYTRTVGGFQVVAGTEKMGFENQTDSDGGTNLKNITASNTLIDLTSLNIIWDNRYNYRIGGANIYRISEIVLYKNGVATETQSGNIDVGSNIGSLKEGHFGTNINPSSRTTTGTPTAAGVGYPKYL